MRETPKLCKVPQLLKNRKNGGAGANFEGAMGRVKAGKARWVQKLCVPRID